MARDLNGRPVATGGLQRLFGRLRRGAGVSDEPAPGDADLVVVAESFDDAAASSRVLENSSWRESDQAVVRHLLAVPAGRLDDVAATASQDGYVVVDTPDTVDTVATVATTTAAAQGLTCVALARTQLVDALHCSQERSRMAGLGARHDGVVLGWQVLQRRVG